MKNKTITQKSQKFQSLRNEQLYYVRSVLYQEFVSQYGNHIMKVIMVSYNYSHLLTLSNAIIIITFKDTNYDIKKELHNKMENAYFLVHFPYTYYQPGTLVRLLNVSSDIFFLQKI